ncbi:hypothetical protein POM88_027513 [Heracleum sosnowskyi]|uniref:Uncharacterized protein n=1 Tax=Heracleum sosnowskyi TaxID=360622 RepID=A0AAD8I7Y2_9APIA|nr:hypothetical protein POM88_027513 [Heracleum sosnowskyi]
MISIRYGTWLSSASFRFSVNPNLFGLFDQKIVGCTGIFFHQRKSRILRQRSLKIRRTKNLSLILKIRYQRVMMTFLRRYKMLMPRRKVDAPLIYNLDFKDDPNIYVFPKLKYVGIELWQVTLSGLLNFIDGVSKVKCFWWR